MLVRHTPFALHCMVHAFPQKADSCVVCGLSCTFCNNALCQGPLQGN